jgi:hypothetical protein
MAASPATLKLALQLAFCHLFFNITGILLFFPVPFLRRFPIKCARFLGRTTARYRWFALAYLLLMFLIFPGCLMALSFAGNVVFIVVLGVVGAIALFVVVVNVLHNSPLKSRLPVKLQTWYWLPEPLRSLRPLDRLLVSCFAPLQRVCCQCCVTKCNCLFMGADDAEFSDSDDEDDDSFNSDSTASASSCFCCCSKGENRDHSGMQKVEQTGQAVPEIVVVEQPDVAAAASPFHSHSFKKLGRTCKPIYKPSSHKHKSKKNGHSPASAPLIPIPESHV